MMAPFLNCFSMPPMTLRMDRSGVVSRRDRASVSGCRTARRGSIQSAVAKPKLPELPVHDLAERHYGLTSAIGEGYTEAARICFNRHHKSPVDVSLLDDGEESAARVRWKKPTKRELGAWANEIDATEAGAYGVAIAACELSCGLYAVHRAETKTGADYYLRASSGPTEDLEDCFRLEVSGVDRGSASDVGQRLRQKLEQAERGKSNLPAIAGVVGFLECLVLLESLEVEE